MRPLKVKMAGRVQRRRCGASDKAKGALPDSQPVEVASYICVEFVLKLRMAIEIESVRQALLIII